MPSHTARSPRQCSEEAVPPCSWRRSRTGDGLVTAWPDPLMRSCARTCCPSREPRPGKGDSLVDPSVKNPSAAANPGPFAEGDRVLVPFHPHPVEGIVTEDRGIRQDGRRYYRVRIQVDDVSDP